MKGQYKKIVGIALNYKKIGRPRKRWREVVVIDLRNVTIWKRMARNRMEWRKITQL